MSARNTVAFTTSASEREAPASTAATLRSAWPVSSPTPPGTTSPVLGSSPICPAVNTRRAPGAVTTAWL